MAIEGATLGSRYQPQAVPPKSNVPAAARPSKPQRPSSPLQPRPSISQADYAEAAASARQKLRPSISQIDCKARESVKQAGPDKPPSSAPTAKASGGAPGSRPSISQVDYVTPDADKPLSPAAAAIVSDIRQVPDNWWNRGSQDAQRKVTSDIQKANSADVNSALDTLKPEEMRTLNSSLNKPGIYASSDDKRALFDAVAAKSDASHLVKVTDSLDTTDKEAFAASIASQARPQTKIDYVVGMGSRAAGPTEVITSSAAEVTSRTVNTNAAAAGIVMGSLHGKYADAAFSRLQDGQVKAITESLASPTTFYVGGYTALPDEGAALSNFVEATASSHDAAAKADVFKATSELLNNPLRDPPGSSSSKELAGGLMTKLLDSDANGVMNALSAGTSNHPSVGLYLNEMKNEGREQQALDYISKATRPTEPLYGPKPQAADRSMLDVAEASGDPNQQPAGGKWMRVSDAELQAKGFDLSQLEDESTGFRAGIYKDANNNVVVGYAGTDPKSGKDIGTDIEQGTGFSAKQYSEAVQVAKDAKMAYGSNLVGLTGHSLGGGLASLASAATNVPAVTFNPAGVSNNSYRDAGLVPADAEANAEQGLVRKYVVDGDPLDWVNKSRVAPDAPGVRIELPDPDPLTWYQIATVPSHIIHLHLIDSLKDTMDTTHPWPDGQSPDLPPQPSK